jgi:hypothetical protein
MMRKLLRSFTLALTLLSILLLIEQILQAGPPLICHPIEIGNSRSLPWGDASDWRAVKRDYDLNRLVEDTLALLTADTPVLARMETLRRATVYAVWARYDREVGFTVKNEKVADVLLTRLMDRIRESVRNNHSYMIALFDAGYLQSCFQQANSHSGRSADKTANTEGYSMMRKALDGYTMVRKAVAGRGGTAEMEFAAALASKFPQQPMHIQHLQRAVAGAQEGTLLARNIVKHFGQRGQSFADLRAQVVRIKTNGQQ